MDDEMEFQAMGVHFRLSELHWLAWKYNERRGNHALVVYHRMCYRFERYLAHQHYLRVKKGG